MPPLLSVMDSWPFVRLMHTTISISSGYSGFSKKLARRRNAFRAVSTRCAVCSIFSPTTVRPYSSRISSTAFLPFCRGTDRPHDVHTYMSYGSRLSHTSSMSRCHGSGLNP